MPDRTAPPESYEPCLAEKLYELPAIVYRVVDNVPATAADFQAQWPTGLDQNDPKVVEQLAKDPSYELRMTFGVSMWCSREKAMAYAISSDKRIARMDMTRCGWARLAMLRNGPSHHWDVFGVAKRMLDAIVDYPDL